MRRYDPLFPLPPTPRIASLEEQVLGAPGSAPADTRMIDYLRECGNAQPGFLSRIYARLTRRTQHK